MILENDNKIYVILLKIVLKNVVLVLSMSKSFGVK